MVTVYSLTPLDKMFLYFAQLVTHVLRAVHAQCARTSTGMNSVISHKHAFHLH